MSTGRRLLASTKRYSLVAVAIVGVALVTTLPLRQKTTPSVGLEVLIPTEGPKVRLTDHWGNTSIVQIDSKHVWSLNGKTLPSADLERALTEQVCHGTARVVFLDASPDIGYGEAIRAVEAIRSACGLNVAVITPAMKKLDSDRFYLKKPAP